MSDTHSTAGLIEIQINGGWGHDFTADPNTMWAVGERLPEVGVTSFLPTIVSAPYETVSAAIDVVRVGPPAGYPGADVIGLHVEGPWISPEWRGAHNPTHLRSPELAVAREWAESGKVRIVTMAPELDGAFEVATALADSGVVVSAGHSGADFETASRALAGPWHSVTHLFNQMSGFHHRSPGMVGAALLSDRPCGLIVDGIHCHPSAVRLAWSALGPDRLVLVTDAMAAAGLGKGKYRLGDHEVVVGDDGPRSGPETLAGSTLTMDQAMANLVSWTGATVDQARACASVNPARLLGWGAAVDHVGSSG
ncbi:MAG TPA: N-acetylglucosamine-6-phosphate deacetylase [Acidimicrobiia bacterium]|nr:N-acetylglucosamine-6-phosphate deacetylase [Acidimicrobiia bacterium]